MYLVMILCGCAAWIYTLLTEPLWATLKSPLSARSAFASLAVISLSLFFYLPPPTPPHPQFEAAAKLYYDLVENLPQEWTIVGQAEEYELVYTRGFHMNVGEFLRRYKPTEPSHKFPTPYLFIVLEKKPKADLPISYHKPLRHQEESLLQDWVRLYAIYHDNLRLYRDSEYVAIYMIHDPTVGKQEDGLP